MRVAAVREGRSLQLLRRLLHGVPHYDDRLGGQLSANLQSVLSTRSNSRLARGIIARHGRLSVIKVDLCIRYYYSTTQNRNTGNLHRPPGGLKTSCTPRQERFTRDDGNYR